MAETIERLAAQAELNLIPAKSHDSYYKEYEKLLLWMEKKETQSIDETVMLAYMMEMSKVYKSSTLWCMHSKLQAVFRIERGIDLASYHKLHAFMKGTNKGYEPKKSSVFTEDNLREFFVQAPENTFLFLKTVATCGIFGSCRRYEMCNLRMSDITRQGSALIICIRPGKTEIGRKFAIIDDPVIKYAQTFNNYLSLRPKNVTTDRVFLKYSNGKCTKQDVGINTFGKCPTLVARFLNLPNPDTFTGHAFRRTSATIMANGGMNVDELKRQVGWKSSAVASGYIEESTVNKIKVSKLIAGVVKDGGSNIESTSLINVKESTTSTVSSTMDAEEIQIASEDTNFDATKKGIPFKLSKNQNCTFNIFMQ